MRVWIHITENVAATAQASQGQRNRQTQNAASAMIDFRKSGKGGVVDITAPGFSGQPDIKQNSGNVTVTLKKLPVAHAGATEFGM